ncbi:lecithin retinol acyltransferase family protein [Variovorax sp. GrIS 2.14]|uniref:lecithin retinol acyltransferase family protein n=1 Tax=Variovorax sp. GrIS 2.14 TaxID=3071709 RepID=UPI0038F676E6
MFPWMAQPPFVGLISRPKLSGIGNHVGVQLPSGAVAHMTRAGAEIVSLVAFAQGRMVEQKLAAPQQTYGAVTARASQSVGRTEPYHFVSLNCEHYAAWVLGQKPISPQIAALAVFALAYAAYAFTS